jgi:hypothetical protein
MMWCVYYKCKSFYVQNEYIYIYIIYIHVYERRNWRMILHWYIPVYGFPLHEWFWIDIFLYSRYEERLRSVLSFTSIYQRTWLNWFRNNKIGKMLVEIWESNVCLLHEHLKNACFHSKQMCSGKLDADKKPASNWQEHRHFCI